MKSVGRYVTSCVRGWRSWGGGSVSHSFTRQIFKSGWHHLKISREQTDCADCSYKEKNTGHILIWLSLITPWRSSCLTSCAGAFEWRQTHLSQKRQRKLEGNVAHRRVAIKGPGFDSQGVFNLSLADGINSIRRTKCDTEETNKLWRWWQEYFQAIRVNQSDLSLPVWPCHCCSRHPTHYIPLNVFMN